MKVGELPKKGEGVMDLHTLYPYNTAGTYIGHTQAPTSSVRSYNPNTTHPFCVESWYVAHNGVLSNAADVKKKYMLDKANDVDTSVIPALIDYSHIMTNNPERDEIKAIISALEDIEGTFSCWVHSKRTNNTYLARCGSTLFVDHDTGDFSSARADMLTPLDEGKLYKIDNGLHNVGKFNFNSPYFII
jgi:glucosamine 6-phosphate synthetase-like amidotransferase/phosphosugar isomerase protein